MKAPRAIDHIEVLTIDLRDTSPSPPEPPSTMAPRKTTGRARRGPGPASNGTPPGPVAAGAPGVRAPAEDATGPAGLGPALAPPPEHVAPPPPAGPEAVEPPALGVPAVFPVSEDAPGSTLTLPGATAAGVGEGGSSSGTGSGAHAGSGYGRGGGSGTGGEGGTGTGGVGGGGGGSGLPGGTGRGGLGGGDAGAAAGPRFLIRATPLYPPLARRLGREATVLLRLTIDERGRLADVDVVEPAEYGFTDAAVDAVRRSVFAPAEWEGRPVRCRALLPIRFVLRRSE